MYLDDSQEHLSELKKKQFIEKNFFELPLKNQYQCKQCSVIIEYHNPDAFHQMKNHVETLHSRKFNEFHQNSTPKAAYFYERLRNVRPPPQYLYKYTQQRYIKFKLVKDEWLDRLAIDQYPIPVIVDSILNRLAAPQKQQRNKFFQQSKKRARYLQMCIPEIKQFLPTLPLDLLPGQVLQIIKDTHKISAEAAKLVVKKYYYPYLGESDVLRYLGSRGIRYRRFKSRDNQTLVIFASKKMRANYLQFGDCVSMTSHFVPLSRDKTSRHFNIIIFAGLDRNAQTVIFGMGLANGEGEIYYKKTLQFFFEIMDYVEPETFITNNFSIMQKVIKQLKKEYGFRFNYRSNWKSVKQLLRLGFDSSAGIGLAMDLFSGALSSYSLDEYKNIMQFVRNGNLLEPGKIDNFECKNYKYCLSSGKSTFTGFCLDETFYKRLNKQIQKSFPYHKFKGLFYALCFRFEKNIEHSRIKHSSFIDPRQTYKFRVFISPQLQYLSGVLQSQIFKRLLANYQKSIFNVSVIEKKESSYILLDKTAKNGRTLPTRIKVSYLASHCFWKCSCTELYSTGLPCSHLIKVISKTKGCIAYYISQRWMTNPDISDFPKPDDQFEEEEAESIEQKEEVPKVTYEGQVQCKIKDEYIENQMRPVMVNSQEQSDISVSIIKVEKKKKPKYIVIEQQQL